MLVSALVHLVWLVLPGFLLWIIGLIIRYVYMAAAGLYKHNSWVHNLDCFDTHTDIKKQRVKELKTEAWEGARRGSRLERASQNIYLQCLHKTALSCYTEK